MGGLPRQAATHEPLRQNRINAVEPAQRLASSKIHGCMLWL
jgi:hypothetical protein